jgi:nucleotidyltransferase/DNA polymerase involved in DNA repair
MLAISCYLCDYSITDYCSSHNIDPEECVRQMRQTVFEETQLTVSAGIAPNKVCIALLEPSFTLKSESYKPFMQMLAKVLWLVIMTDSSLILKQHRFAQIR